VPLEPGKSILKTIFTETRFFLSLTRRAFLLSEEISKALVTLDEQRAEIKALKEEVRVLRIQNELQAARLEGIAIRAAAEATGELSRRLGYLEGRASRD
jgi:uncharacterized protein (DUF3084 family)